MKMQSTCTQGPRGVPLTGLGLIPAVAFLFAWCGCAGPRSSAAQERAGSSSPGDVRDTPSTPQSGRDPVATKAGAAEDPSGSSPAPGGRLPAQGTPAPPPASGGAPYPIHGFLSSSYRARWTSSADDRDLFEVLSLDLGDPARNPWTGHVMTRLEADLDGKSGRSSVFHDLNDTYDGAVTVKLYDAWMERRGLGVLDRVRLGRQTLWDTPVFAWFDGASAETKEMGARRLRLGAFGGVPVHVFESSHEGDLLAGTYAEAGPWPGGRVRLDYMRLEDEGQLGAHRNDLWRLGAWQSVAKHLRLEAAWTRLEEEDRDVSASATWWDPQADLTLRASWFRLLSTQKDLTPEVDPFFASLFDLFPYQQVQLLASKGLSEKVRVQAGTDVRRVSEDGDVGQYNRDFERYFATVTVQDLFPAGVIASATGEVWNSGASDIETWGLDLTRRFEKRLDVSAGSYYSLYKVDATTGQERDEVRTYYLRLRWKRTSAMTWDLRYELEDEDPEAFQTFRLGMSWRF
jgi:hypothetical protein